MRSSHEPPSGFVARIDFLGTGNAFSPPGRMHALILLDGHVLVDTPPTVLFQLQRTGASPADIEHLLFTHWHADHTFGFPFLLLERQHVSDPDSTRALSVHLRPGGRDILGLLCRMGFPGSLDAALEGRVNWSESESGELVGTEWSFERFPVCHTPETDPHGYELVHSSGFRLLHCGDSGPCDEIEQRAANADAVLLEMGIPDFVNSPHHHTPSDVISFAQRYPDALVLVTHNFASGAGIEEGFPMPELPDFVHQLEDGDALIIGKDGSISLDSYS